MDPQQPTQIEPSDQNEPQPQIVQSGNLKHAHKFIFGYILIIILVAAVGGVYSWQHKKVSQLTTQVNSDSSKIAKLNKQSTGTTTTNQTVSNTELSSPAILKQQSLLTTLYMPSGSSLIDTGPTTIVPASLAENYTESETDVVGDWNVSSTGSLTNPSSIGGELGNVTITSLNQWEATADPSGVSYVSQSGTTTGAMTTTEKSTFVGNLKTQTTSCSSVSTKGFATTDKNYNVCYTLVSPKATGGEYTLDLSGYGDIGGSINYLRGYVYLPNSYQSQLSADLAALGTLSSTLK